MHRSIFTRFPNSLQIFNYINSSISSFSKACHTKLTCQDTVQLEVEFDDEPIIVDVKLADGEPGAGVMCKVEVAEEAIEADLWLFNKIVVISLYDSR